MSPTARTQQDTETPAPATGCIDALAEADALFDAKILIEAMVAAADELDGTDESAAAERARQAVRRLGRMAGRLVEQAAERLCDARGLAATPWLSGGSECSAIPHQADAETADTDLH